MAEVPFFKAEIGDDEVQEVVATLRSGWLTTGPRVRSFESAFAEQVKATHAIALNSATAALHLALEALGVRSGDAVLVPTLTFAATAEVVRYFGALPILVDCDAATLNIDLADAASKLAAFKADRLCVRSESRRVVGIIPVHVGGAMMNIDEVRTFAQREQLWVVEDAAHAFPAAWRSSPSAEWTYCGGNTADVTCFSFYANKTITTGEGGMAVTGNLALAERIRLMSLHGLSRDAWTRYSGSGSWDYRIVAPGFKYNMTDLAAAIGIHQLRRAETMRRRREQIAGAYCEALGSVEELQLPERPVDRIHSWHLFPIRLRLPMLRNDRAGFIEELKQAGIATSVHWRPLHLHPYYQETFGWAVQDFPVATPEWSRLVSLPLYSSMTQAEIDAVVAAVKHACRANSVRLVNN